MCVEAAFLLITGYFFPESQTLSLWGVRVVTASGGMWWGRGARDRQQL